MILKEYWNMAITIYDRNGLVKMEVAVEDNSTQTKEVGGDNVLALSWTQHEYVKLDVNDYADFEGERYWVMEKYMPEMKNSMEWKYDVKMYGIESMAKRFLVLQTVDGDAEPVFVLTAPPGEHLKLIVGCLNEGMNTNDWKVGEIDESVATENVVMEYEGTTCSEALAQLAEKIGTEGWIDGQTLNLCECVQGGEDDFVELGYGEGLTSLVADVAENASFFTRLYPIGSSRNIVPEEYGGHNRLLLPEGKKYVDVEGLIDDYGVIERYEKDAFEGVYPRYIGTVEKVELETRKNEDGEDYTVYYIKDTQLGSKFNPNDYLLPDVPVRISFQDGELAGLGTSDDHYFEANWDDESKMWEIITIWPYGDDRQLPGDGLIPQVGDHYIPWNMKMPEEYYGMAENELSAEVDLYIQKQKKDVTRWMAETDYLHMKEVEEQRLENGKRRLTIGSRIRLKSEKYFREKENCCRDSRVTRITRKVVRPTQMSLEISDALSKGVMDVLGNAVDNVRSYAKSIRQSISVPDIIKTGDKTRPTDNNLYSAIRSDVNYWRKDKDINSEHDIKGQNLTAEEELEVREAASIGGNATIGGDAVVIGNAVVDGDMTVEGDSVIEGKEIVKGAGGTEWGDGEFDSGVVGAKVWKESGGWHGQFDYLFVTKKFTAKELEIMHESHIGGSLVISAANCVVADVEVSSNATWGTIYKVWFLAEDSDGKRVYNMWKPGDLARCQTANLSNENNEISNHYYWRWVYDVSSSPVEREDGKLYHYIRFYNLPVFMDEGSDAPEVGDEIVQMGHVSDESRQGVILLTSVVNGEQASVPFIRIYKGVGSTERDAEGNITRGVFQMPKARIDLNPWDPHMDVSQLTITAQGEETKTMDQYIREREPDGVLVITGDTDDAPTTDDEFIEECLEILELEQKEDMVGAFYVTTEWRVWQYQEDYTWKEVTDTNLKSLLEEVQSVQSGINVLRNKVEAYTTTYSAEIGEIKNSMVTTAEFAGLFSAQVNSKGLATKAEVSTAVREGISTATISADQVNISSGDKTLGNFFSLDGATGDVTMHDLYARNITLEGVLNNLIQHINIDNQNDYGIVDGSKFRLNPLMTGQYVMFENIEGNDEQSLQSVTIVLPSAFYSDDGAIIDGVIPGDSNYPPYTMTEMRQMIGKRFYLMPAGDYVMVNIEVENNLLYERAEGYYSNGNMNPKMPAENGTDLFNLPTENEGTGNSYFEKRVYYRRWAQYPAVLQQVYILECKLGIDSGTGTECIYWEIQVSGEALTEGAVE